MQVETLSIVVTAAATVATALIAAAALVQGHLHRVADLKRRKPHVHVSFREHHSVLVDARRDKHGSVRVINDGEVNIAVEQILFEFGEGRGARRRPVEWWNATADYRRLLVPGDFVDVILGHDQNLVKAYGRPKCAVARLTTGAEFRSDVITEQTPGAFTFV